jgi:ATP phosphoribosyltransferase regulatory subunit HisZ
MGSTGGGRRSLLQFAALDMVDKSDVLMALSLIDFFEAFVSVTRVSPHTAGKVEAIRALLREAMAGDDMLKAALLSLPDRTVEEEADDLRRWLREILPGESVRVAQR